MDHARIDEDQVADRYLMGKLDDAQRRSFEEHFVDCAACLDKLETLESLRAALKELPSERTRPAAPAVSPSPSPSVARFRRPAIHPLVGLLAAACLLLASAASLFFYGEMRRSRRELEAERRSSQAARQRHAELEATIRERVRPSEAPLAAAVFTLNLTRGSLTDPGDRVRLPPAPGWIVLIFDRPDGSKASEYRVRLSGAAGQPVGGAVAASPAAGGMLAVGLPSSLLAPGDYRLAVEDAGSARLLATYRFRAVPNR